jgi:nitroreductase
MPPTILLANTWAPHGVAPEAVPAYLCAFVGALVGAGAPLRLLVRRAEDARALRAAIPALADTHAWEAAVLPRLDDAPGAARVLAAVDVLFWADDARTLTLARHGAVLLKAAAHARVRRVVYRAQLTSRHARRDFEDALDLCAP